MALLSLVVSVRISGYPEVHPCLWLIIPLLLTCGAIWDTSRCLQKRWNFYHGGVLLLLYMDLMVLLLVAFLLVAPYSQFVL